ncbi:MAG: Gx transporter family protein [Lachnospiraceae bacterium]|nr:Gx transporter family protein [Lachnospiraceae bacterium]
MVAYVALMTALAAVAGYLEMLFPINYFGIPGVKAGLANVVSLVALYMFGPLYAFLIMVARVLLDGFMFGKMYSVIFGLTGGALSMTVKIILKRTKAFKMTGVSAAGGVFHNIGQLIVAIITLEGINLIYYIPVLVLSGTVCGCLMGFIASSLYERIGEGKTE